MTIFAIIGAVLALTGSVAVPVALAAWIHTAASRPVPRPLTVRVRRRRR